MSVSCFGTAGVCFQVHAKQLSPSYRFCTGSICNSLNSNWPQIMNAASPSLTGDGEAAFRISEEGFSKFATCIRLLEGYGHWQDRKPNRGEWRTDDPLFRNLVRISEWHTRDGIFQYSFAGFWISYSFLL